MQDVRTLLSKGLQVTDVLGFILIARTQSGSFMVSPSLYQPPGFGEYMQYWGYGAGGHVDGTAKGPNGPRRAYYGCYAKGATVCCGLDTEGGYFLQRMEKG